MLWQSVRVVRPLAWIALLGLMLPSYIFLERRGLEPAAICMLYCLGVGLVAGVNVFGSESRSRTQAFLASHGLRPGLVWLVKTLVWLSALVIFWGLAALMLVLIGVESIRLPAGFGDVFLLIAGILLSTAAVASLCGMIFPRSITAGVVSILLCFLLVLPLGSLYGVRLLPGWFFLVYAFAILTVSFAWSGDWMFDRPGAWRWVRLVLLLTGMFGALLSGYAAYRVVSVPTLDPSREAQIFQPNSVAIVLIADNAADLYREAASSMSEMPGSISESPRSWPIRLMRVARPRPKRRSSGWERTPRHLNCCEKPRKCPPASLPISTKRRCSHRGGNNCPPFTRSVSFSRSPSVSVRPRETSTEPGAISKSCFGSRQWSGNVTVWEAFHGHFIERQALVLAMAWAAGPKQTVERLHAARDAWRKLPPQPDPAGPIRAEARIMRNTELLPRSELRALALAMIAEPHNAPGLWNTNMVDLLTTPWELARASRAYRLLFASKIDEAKLDAWHAGRGQDSYNAWGGWSSLSTTAGKSKDIAPATLQEIYQSTPQLGVILPPMDGYLREHDRNEVGRRTPGADSRASRLAASPRRPTSRVAHRSGHL